MSSRLQVGDPVEMNDAREDWMRLALDSACVFATYEWAAAWWSAYGGGRQTLVLPVRDESGACIALFPLYVHQRGPMRIGRLIGHGAGDELGPVCAPSDQPAVGQALRRALDGGGLPIDVLLGEAVPGVDEWPRYLGAAVLRRASSPSTILDVDDWEGYLATLSRSTRHHVRRRERRLQREHDLAYRLTRSANDLERDMDIFFKLHGARWSTASSVLGRADFYMHFAARALANGWLRLAILEIDGQPAAARLDFSYAGIYFAYNSGRDLRWDTYSPGFVLRAMAMRDAVQAGVREFRFLRGDEQYKSMFATTDRGSLTVAAAASGRGRLALAGARVLGNSAGGRKLLGRALGTS